MNYLFNKFQVLMGEKKFKDSDIFLAAVSKSYFSNIRVEIMVVFHKVWPRRKSKRLDIFSRHESRVWTRGTSFASKTLY